MPALRAPLLVTWLALWGACYAPKISTGAPCDNDQQCPIGQTCETGRPAPTCVLSGSSSMPDAAPLDAALDAPPDTTPARCVGGDSVCLFECAASDPDCMTTCGDGRCVGNAGEMCNQCAIDCKTFSAVCGNGQCDPGESPDCYADCGPVPWPWVSDEASLMAMINAVRTGGHRCPSQGLSHTVPALVAGNYLADAREWSWELAHMDFFNDEGMSCNGRTFNQRRAGKPYDSYIFVIDATTITEALDGWLGAEVECLIVMDPMLRSVSVAVANDVTQSYVVLFAP